MSAPVLVLYERAECHLCEAAALLLKALAVPRGFELRRVDIDSDDALLRRYGFEIPVVALAGGTELARAPIDATALRRALDALTAESPRS